MTPLTTPFNNHKLRLDQEQQVLSCQTDSVKLHHNKRSVIRLPTLMVNKI